MRQLEQLVLDAWASVRPRLESDQHELAKRLARRRRPVLRHPPRAGCLAVRASDTRLPSLRASVPPCLGASEEITLFPRDLRSLCAPVTIHGDTLDEAAEKLGTTPMGLLTARLNDVFDTKHVPGLGGRRGRPVPLLYSREPLDPNANNFSRPDPVWSNMIDLNLDRIPKDLEQTLTRIPCFHERGQRVGDDALHPEHPLNDPPERKRRNRRLPEPEPDYAAWYKWKGDEFVGYDWRSPRMAALHEREEREKERRHELYLAKKREHGPAVSQSHGSLEFRGYTWLCPVCGHTCRTVYYSLPPLNLLDSPSSFSLHPSSRPRVPRLAQIIDIPRMHEGFACARCHGVKFLSWMQAEAWNDIIAYLTGGLLYGREVPKPANLIVKRKRPYKAVINARPAVQRDRVERLLLAGRTRPQIVAELHTTKTAIDQQCWKIFRQHGVHTHKALLQRLNRPLPEWMLPRRTQVLQHLKDGLSQAEIAKKMGITKHAVEHHIGFIRRESAGRVSGRAKRQPASS